MIITALKNAGYIDGSASNPSNSSNSSQSDGAGGWTGGMKADFNSDEVKGDGYSSESTGRQRRKTNLAAGQMPDIQIPKWAKRSFFTVLAIVITLFVIIVVGSNLGTDIMWYTQLGFGNVLIVQYLAPVAVFLIGLIIVTLLCYISLSLAFKLQPKYQLSTLKVGDIKKMKTAFSKHKRLWFFLISLFFGVISGFVFASSTDDLLLLYGSTPFDKVDPIFGLDISFYVFQIPALNFIISSLIGVFTVMLVLCFLTGLIFGQVSTETKVVKMGKVNLLRFARPLRVQLSIYMAVITALSAGSILLSQFDLLTHNNDRITGASWTDVNVRIPVIQICAGLTLIVAVLFLICAFAKIVKVPLISIGVIVIIGVLAGGVLPVIMQNLVVNPNAQVKEKEYIGYNMQATKDAYDLQDIDKQSYNAVTDTHAGQLGQDAETTTQIRLLDPQIVAPTFRQLQQNKQYYSFPDTLSVDKYNINGVSHDTIIAAREIDQSGNDNRNWVNDHTYYTHGFGLVAAYGNAVGDDGRPKFYEKDIPTDGKLTDNYQYEPRIYFSKNAPSYSIVGSDNGQNYEFDYPEAKDNVTFGGDGGPAINNAFTKLLYAIRFGDYQLFFADRINSNSQILYWRDPETRLKKVAPYLELDGRVYPAVVDGHIKWMLDAYTTSDNYPYSKRVNMKTVTKDSVTETSNAVNSLDSQTANYVRNSVKATVDAYNGSVTLYAWDPNDPVLKAWAKIYGQELHPISEISGSLMSHIRYPENLFKIQRSLLEAYHVPDPESFFSGQDFWQVPQDPTTSGTLTSATGEKESNIKQPPYYLTLQMPGNKEPVFSLTSTFIPGGGAKRDILTGFLSVDSDAGSLDGVIGPNYGKIHLLELPKNTQVPGPGQAQNNFNSNAEVSTQLNLLQGSSSSILRGNLLTLPVGGGLIYVQPVYVKSTGSTSFPLLKKVLVAFGDHVGFADTLAGALNQVFGGNSGAVTAGVASSDTPEVTEVTGEGNTTTSTPSVTGDLNQGVSPNDSSALDKAQKALEDAIKALEQAQKALEEAKK